MIICFKSNFIYQSTAYLLISHTSTQRLPQDCHKAIFKQTLFFFPYSIIIRRHFPGGIISDYKWIARDNYSHALTYQMHTKCILDFNVITGKNCLCTDQSNASDIKCTILDLVPRRDSAKADLNGVHWKVFPFYCGLGKGFWTFRFRRGNPPFWNLQNVLSPEGSLRKQISMGSIEKYFHFIVV